MKLSRRGFMGLMGALPVAAGAAYVSVIEPFQLATTRYTLATDKWPADYPPLTIAAFGDPHVGCPSVSLSRLEDIVAKVNALGADIILLLGDYLIEKTRPVLGGKHIEPGPIAAVLGRLRAPLGVYSVLGNHDWHNDGPGMWKAMEAQGIVMLENTARAVTLPTGRKFYVAGLADDSTRTPDIAATLAGTQDAPVIMLSHDPAPFLEMPEEPVVTLSGHTHAGQMALPFFGAIVIPSRAPLKYAYGNINEDGRDLIVTSGIGTSVLPFRAFAKPEIMSIVVTHAPSSRGAGAGRAHY